MKKDFPKQLFITGIGTDVGKTVVSAVLIKALNALYWKPVQSGSDGQTDRGWIQSITGNKDNQFIRETFSFRLPASPHFAASQENEEMDLQKIQLPDSGNSHLVVEGAGGLMVPLNRQTLVIDLISQLKLPVILVVRNYLGSINHTLLSIELLKSKGIDIAGIIVSGSNYNDNEEIIQHFSGVPVIARVEEAKEIDAVFISQQAEQVRAQLSLLFEL